MARNFILHLSLLPAFCLGVIASPLAAQAQQMSLQDALSRAIAGNVQLQQERLTIEQVEAQLDASRGLFDFRLTSDLTFRRTVSPPLTNEDLAGGYTNNLGLSLGILRPLETGGSVRIGTNTNASNSNSRFNCGTVGGLPQDCTVYNSNVNLTFVHPLLRGFGAEIVQANIRRQRVQRDQALLNRQTRASNVLRDVIQGYWELAYSTRDLQIRQAAVELAQEQLRVTQAQIDVGRLAPIDKAAVEQAIGERMQEVVVSEQSLIFRTMDLRRLFGMPIDPSLTPLSVQEIAPAETPEIDLGSEVTRALEANPQLRSLRLGMKLSEIDIQTAENTLKPQLDFQGSIGSTGRKRDFAGSFGEAFGFDQFTWGAGLSLDIPLGNHTAKGQVRVAKIAIDARRLDAMDLELLLRDQVVRLGSTVRTASRRVALAKATVGFAEKNLEAEQARFSVGRSTNNEVLRRQQELKNAQIQVLRATVDLLVNQTALSATTGDLLERHKVALRGS